MAKSKFCIFHESERTAADDPSNSEHNEVNQIFSLIVSPTVDLTKRQPWVSIGSAQAP